MPGRKASAVETIAGSMPVDIVMTTVAAIVGGPLAPLLPVLVKTLASERQRKRLELELAEVTNDLASMKDRLNTISDNQYKLVNETILAFFQTVDQEKINLLRNAICNIVEIENLNSHESYFLSRLMRDISAQEVSFLRRNFVIEKLCLVARPVQVGETVHEIQIDTEDGRLASGLISLGVLAAIGGTIKDLGTFRFTPIAAKLLRKLCKTQPTVEF
jgi:hypothetical protein